MAGKPARGPGAAARRWNALSDGTRVALVAFLLSCITFGVRAWPIFTGEIVADIGNYRVVGTAILDGRFSELYALPYPYPPLWMYVEASAQWASQRWDAGFATLIKLPILAGDIALVVFSLLILRARGLGLGRAFAWSLGIALSPVVIMVSGFHGQFDSMAIALLVGAAYFGEEAPEGRRSLVLSATLLSLAIALKAFPILALPFFLWRCCRSPREAALFAAAALTPTALLLAPYAIVGWESMREGLFGYSGVIDHGWSSLIRSWLSRTTDEAWNSLPGGRAETFTESGRLMFLIAWALVVPVIGRQRRVLDSSLLVFLLFLFLHPGISSQYLLWVVPLGVIARQPMVLPYAVTATLALLGFYMWVWPSILDQPGEPFTRQWALELYYWGDWGWWLCTGVWAAWLLPRPSVTSIQAFPRPATAVLVPCVLAGMVLFSLEAASVFREVRVIVEAF